MKLRIVLAGLIFGSVALAAESGAELFQKALTAERAAGNLEEAIKLYQRIAKEFGSDRAAALGRFFSDAQFERLTADDLRSDDDGTRRGGWIHADAVSRKCDSAEPVRYGRWQGSVSVSVAECPGDEHHTEQ